MPLYVIHDAGSTGDIFVIPEDTANGGTAEATRQFNLPSGLANPTGTAIDGNDLYIVDLSSDNVTVIPADTTNGGTASITRQFNLPSTLASARGATIDGTDLYVVDSSTNDVFVIPADTANGGTASATRQFSLPSALVSPEGITIDGNDLYVADDNINDVFVIPADTANDGTASATRQFSLPSALVSPLGITIDGTDLYVADDNTDDIFVIPANTANGGTASITRRFNLPSGLTFPRGITFLSDQATATISTTDTDIRAGEVFDVDITFDMDVTGFTASDITVTGGTRGTLTENAADDYTLSVTAGSAGTLTVSIAADVVSPGNTAASQDFTVNALPTVTITSSDSDIVEDEEITITFQWSETVSGFATGDVTVSGGTKGTFTSVDADTYTLVVTAGSAGTLTITVAEDAVTLGNAETDANFTISEPASETLTVSISGTTNIAQGEQTTLTATVTGEDSNDAVGTLTYTWTASRGSFVGSTTGAEVTYEADFTDSSDATVDITCSVSRTATDSPTISTSSLTAMTLLGITGQLVNMHITDSIAAVSGVNTAIYDEASSNSALETDSDADLTSSIHINRMRWNTQGSNERFILNNNGSGNLGSYFSGNTSQSVYLIFADGEYFEIDNAQYFSGGSAVARWDLTDTHLINLLNAWDGTENLLLGIADADAIGYIAGSGSETTQVTATASTDPTITISTTETDIRVGDTFDVDIVFSENVTGFTALDITVTGGTRGSLTGSGSDYVLSVTADNTAGSIVVSIPEDAVSPGNVAASETFTSTALPTATVTFNPTSVRHGRDTTATIVWSENVSGFVIGDLSVDVGSLSNFSGSNDTYTVDITAPNTGSGDITLTIAEDAVSVGNDEDTATVAYSALPTVSISYDDVSLASGESAEATFEWSENVSGFTISDLSVDVGSLSNFSGSGDTYTVDITAPSTGAGDITITVAEDAVSIGNDEFTDDTVAYVELVTVTISTDDTDIREGETFDVDFTFSESVTGFTASDISVSGGTRGTLTGNGTDYTLSVTAGSGAGTITVSISRNVVTPENASATQDFTRNALPTATVSFNPTTVRHDRTATATITWSENVSGFVIGDLSVDVGSLSNFSGSNDEYTVDITAPSTGSGDITLTIAEDAITLGNIETVATIAYSAVPTVTIELPSSATGGVAFTATFDWSESVSGFTSSDITISAGTKGAFTTVANDEYTLRITPPSTGDGTITITVAEDAVTIGNAETEGTVDYTEPEVSDTFFFETIDEQFIIHGTEDYELAVEVTGGSEDTVFDHEGLWERFYPDWQHDAAHATGTETGVLYIRSEEVTRLIQNAEWTLTATEGTDTATTTITYNVVAAAPVIESVGTLSLVKDKLFLSDLEVSNNPSSVAVTGDQIALTFEDSEIGVMLTGRLPSENANLTKDSFEGTITASNDGGEDESDININTYLGPFVAAMNATDEEVNVYDIGSDNTQTGATIDLDGAFTSRLAMHDIYVAAWGSTPGINIFRITDGKQHGDTISLSGTGWQDLAMCNDATHSGQEYGPFVIMTNITDGTIQVYDIANENNQHLGDLDLGTGTWGVVEGDASGFSSFVAFDSTNGDFKVLSAHPSYTEITQLGSDVDLGSGTWVAIDIEDLYIVALDNNNNRFRVYEFQNSAISQVGSNQSLGTGNWRDIAISVINVTGANNDIVNIAVVDDTNNRLKVYRLDESDDSISQIGSDVALGTGTWSKIDIAGNYVSVLDTGSHIIKVYEIDDTSVTQVGSDISLGTDNWTRIAMTT